MYLNCFVLQFVQRITPRRETTLMESITETELSAPLLAAPQCAPDSKDIVHHLPTIPRKKLYNQAKIWKEVVLQKKNRFRVKYLPLKR